MSGRMPASSQCYLRSARLTPSTIHRRRCSVFSPDRPLLSSKLKFISSGSQKFRSINLSSNATGNSGENESRAVLDAFFLGKAVAEALNERIESAVGEFLSTIGRLQAEQQKQVQEFQEEVLEKARRAKEQAAREAMEAQGVVSKSTTAATTTVNGVTEVRISASNSETSAGSSPVSKRTNEGPQFGNANEE